MGGITGDSATYAETLTIVRENKNALLHQYENAECDSARTAVLQLARVQLVDAVGRDVAPFWYGTPWDFNGTTEVPGTGTIACGYFVTTILRDVGVPLDRVRLAQQASETIIRSLVDSDSIKRFSRVSIDAFLAAVREWGEGLYIVGLDMHVGFIVSDSAGVRFVHSSFYAPSCVVDEDAAESQILAASSYRVLGKLTADDRFVLSWLRGESISASQP